MDSRFAAYVKQIEERFKTIRSLSEWRSMKMLDSVERITAILDQRQVLLDEISAIREQIREAAPGEDLENDSKYEHLRALIRSITDTDAFLYKKIRERMEEIRTQLNSSMLFRNKALPSYLKQQISFASR